MAISNSVTLLIIFQTLSKTHMTNLRKFAFAAVAFICSVKKFIMEED